MLKKLFNLGDEAMDFKERCRLRMTVSVIFILIGLFGMMISLLGQRLYQVSSGGAAPTFYVGLSAGLIAGGIVKFFTYRRCVKDEALGKKREVYESDERVRMIGLRTWSYTGYTMFLLLYLGIVIAGFFNRTVMDTLMVVLAVNSVVLLLFNRYLKKVM